MDSTRGAGLSLMVTPRYPNACASRDRALKRSLAPSNWLSSWLALSYHCFVSCQLRCRSPWLQVELEGSSAESTDACQPLVYPPELRDFDLILADTSLAIFCVDHTSKHNMAPSKQHDYEPVSGLSFEDKEADVPYSDQNSEDEPFLEPKAPLRLSRIRSSLPWILCAVFATTSAVLTFLLFRQRGRIGEGYINDFRKCFHSIIIAIVS
jgi:hypothetical protein